MFGRTLKASIAKDNGRTAEFIRRRVSSALSFFSVFNFIFIKEYPDKTKCYECGEMGHLSYKCEKNLLGEREPPPKKARNRKKKVIKELTEVLLLHFNRDYNM